MSSPIPSRSTFRSAVLPVEAIESDLLFVPVFGAEDTLADCPTLDAAAVEEWRRAVHTREFSGKAYTSVTAATGHSSQLKRVCFVSVGTASEVDVVRWRRVAATCGYIAQQKRVGTCAWLVRQGADISVVAEAAADGLSTAEFDAGTYRSDRQAALSFPGVVTIVAAPGADSDVLSAAVARGRVIGQATNTARMLVNEPANVLTPGEFAARALLVAGLADLHIDVLDEGRMRDLGMGLTLAVSQGSAESPRLVVMHHAPGDAPEGPVLGLVGKGVTFDTGGVSIKPSEGMERMKGDMAGGAAVVAAMWALATLRAPCRVIGIVPMVENMVGGRAYRPGDVFTAANGKTVEVLNTDAEGRLVLADALCYARTLGATHLVDIATLTGHIVVGLGRTVSGLMGAPDSWVDVLRSSAARAGDRIWPLPLYEEVTEQLRSEIADLVNVGGRPGGAIAAAAFLREFTGGLPWAHLDIAGTAWAETREPYLAKGATGAGVRTLIEVATTVGAWGRIRTD